MRTRDYKISIDTGSAWGDTLVGMALIAIAISLPLAWITHIVWIIVTLASDKGATAGQMALGAIGAFMPPIGIVHGYLIWMGVA